ncbi:hypothetical protein JHK82_027866 [Glycine max]|nr:hypothetical protein JHK82_027866 [Glycine max]
MRRGAKRKTKQGQEAIHDAPEDNKPKAQPRAKRAKTSKPQSEPKYFEDKRNLCTLYLRLFWFGALTHAGRFDVYMGLQTIEEIAQERT